MSHLACLSWNSGCFFLVSSEISSAKIAAVFLNQILKKRIFICGSVYMVRVWNRKQKTESHSTHRGNKNRIRYQGDGRVGKRSYILCIYILLYLYIVSIVYSFLQIKKGKTFFLQTEMVQIREIMHRNVHIQPANNCYMKYLCNSIKNSLHS